MLSSSSFAASNNKYDRHKKKQRPHKRKKEKSLDNVSLWHKFPTRSSSRLLRENSFSVSDDTEIDYDDDHIVNDDVIKVLNKSLVKLLKFYQ